MRSYGRNMVMACSSLDDLRKNDHESIRCRIFHFRSIQREASTINASALEPLDVPRRISRRSAETSSHRCGGRCQAPSHTFAGKTATAQETQAHLTQHRCCNEVVCVACESILPSLDCGRIVKTKNLLFRLVGSREWTLDGAMPNA